MSLQNLQHSWDISYFAYFYFVIHKYYMFDASNFFKCLFSLATSKSLAREKPGNYSDIAQNRDKSHKELFFMSKSPRVSNSVVVPRGLRKQRRLGLVCKDIVESFYCFAYRCHHTRANYPKRDFATITRYFLY